MADDRTVQTILDYDVERRDALAPFAWHAIAPPEHNKE